MDRTVVRMAHGSLFVKVLDRRGNEHSFTLGSPAAGEYENYLKVSEEYIQWVFLSDGDQKRRENARHDKQTAIDNEL